jgi:hypothetical protein
VVVEVAVAKEGDSLEEEEEEVVVVLMKVLHLKLLVSNIFS